MTVAPRPEAMPMKIEINAFAGVGVGAVASALHPHHGRWVGQGLGPASTNLLGPQPLPNLKDWTDPRVGWGLVLPEKPGLSPQQLATADDAPSPIRKLVAHRSNAPVFRYGSNLREWAIRRYEADGSSQDLALVGGPRGNQWGQLPRYLLLYGKV
jgi:hypothetical protein